MLTDAINSTPTGAAIGQDIADNLDSWNFFGFKPFKGLADWFRSVVSTIGNLQCQEGVYSGLTVLRSAIGFASRWGVVRVPEVEGVLDYFAGAACPTQLPDVNTINRILLSGLIQGEVWQAWVNFHGQCTDPATLAVWAQRTRPNVQQIQSLYLRGIIQSDEYYTRMRNEGILDQTDQSNIDDFLRSIPDGTRFVQYERAGVFNTDTQTTYYDQANPSQSYVASAGSVGWWWGLGDFGPLQGASGLPDIATAEWQTSLTWPTPAQAVSLLFRLDPDRDRSWEPDWMQNVEMTYTDVLACFDRAGQLPYFQDHLASLQVKVPGVRQLNVMAQYGDLQEEVATDWIKRTGLPTAISQQYVQALLEKVRQQRLQKEISRSKLNIAAAWQLGSISDQDLIELYQQLGMKEDETQTALNLAQVEYQRKRQARYVSVLRRAFIKGMMNGDQAIQALDQLGLQAERVSDLVIDWTFELNYTENTLSAGKVINDAVNGLISLPSVVTRLRNLHFNDQDIEVMIGELALKIQQKEEKLLEKEAKLIEQAQKKLEQAIRQQQAALRQQQSALSRHGSPRELADWLCRGLIGEDEARERMTFLGWPDADQNRLIITACKDLSATQVADFAKKGIMPVDEALLRLGQLKFTPEDAVRLLQDKGVPGVTSG